MERQQESNLYRSLEQIGEEENEYNEYNEENGDFDDYDLFEEMRREEVLRQIGQAQENNGEEPHEELEEILRKQEMKDNRKKEYEKQDQIKKLRQRDALEFFRKMKILFLHSFRESIKRAHQSKTYSQTRIDKLLSFCCPPTIIALQKMKGKPVAERKRSDLIELVRGIFENESLELNNDHKREILWAFAHDLGVGFRKVEFIDISDVELESYYNLKYGAEKKGKKVIKELDKLKNKLRRKSVEQQLSNKKFKNIESYSFTQLNHNQESQSHHEESLSESPISTMAMDYRGIDYFCQIYCSVQQSWQFIFIPNLHIVSPEDIKSNVLQHNAVVGFYGSRILSFKQEYDYLAKERTSGHVIFNDLTNVFADKNQSVISRRHRIGCKTFYKKIISASRVFKTLFIFPQHQARLIELEQNKQLEEAFANFPKTKKEMKMSEYFIVPSLVDKYMFLDSSTACIEGKEFQEERVYYRKDLIKVCSNIGWVDLNRMVKLGEQPVKTTENRNKQTTKLYRFTQTEPFRIRFDENGDFVLDEDFNTIYVPPEFQIPQSYVIIPDNVERICKKNNFKAAKVVQGFENAGMHVVPIKLGYLVEERNREEIEKQVKEREQKIEKNKSSRRQEHIRSMWKKLFKSIIISQNI